MSTDYRDAALANLRENPVCHMATIDGDRPVNRVMHGGRVDDDFTVWFATGLSSNKVSQLAKNPRTCLSFFNGKCDVYIHGRGEVFSDQATRDEHWHDTLSRYFPGGKTDPEYAIIRITPDSVQYRNFETTGFESHEVLE